jgi:uncharacterized phage-associated protein
MSAARPAPTDDVADYIIAKCAETDTYLNVLKLHKLLYYFRPGFTARLAARSITVSVTPRACTRV